MSNTNKWTLFLSLGLLGSGCAESSELPGTTEGSGGSSLTSSSGQGSGSSGSTGSGVGGGAAGIGGLVVNEISAVSSEDWVELFNAGDAPVDLTGLRVADEDKPGAPKLADAITFTKDTTLAPGAYLFILAGQASPAPGPQSKCDPGASPCFHAVFGLNKDGDTLFVVGAGDEILIEAVYPPDAVPAGQTWGRLPNGTGTFAGNKPTPSAENKAP